MFAISGDLPFGSLSMPGAGMMPKLVTGLMILFGLVLILGGRREPALRGDRMERRQSRAESGGHHGGRGRELSDARLHLTMSLLVFVLLVVIERKPMHYAAAYAIALTGIAWWVFGKALKAPLETGILGF